MSIDIKYFSEPIFAQIATQAGDALDCTLTPETPVVTKIALDCIMSTPFTTPLRITPQAINLDPATYHLALKSEQEIAAEIIAHLISIQEDLEGTTSTEAEMIKNAIQSRHNEEELIQNMLHALYPDEAGARTQEELVQRFMDLGLFQFPHVVALIQQEADAEHGSVICKTIHAAIVETYIGHILAHSDRGAHLHATIQEMLMNAIRTFKGNTVLAEEIVPEITMINCRVTLSSNTGESTLEAHYVKPLAAPDTFPPAAPTRGESDRPDSPLQPRNLYGSGAYDDDDDEF